MNFENNKHHNCLLNIKYRTQRKDRCEFSKGIHTKSHWIKWFRRWFVLPENATILNAFRQILNERRHSMNIFLNFCFHSYPCCFYFCVGHTNTLFVTLIPVAVHLHNKVNTLFQMTFASRLIWILLGMILWSLHCLFNLLYIFTKHMITNYFTTEKQALMQQMHVRFQNCSFE